MHALLITAEIVGIALVVGALVVLFIAGLFVRQINKNGWNR